MKTKDFLYIAVIIFLAYYTISTHFKSRTFIEEQKSLVSAISDTLTKTRNSKGELLVEISVLKTEKSKDFTELQTKDKEIENLQKLVKESKLKSGSATILKTVTNIYDTIKTTVLDTSFSVYGFELKNDWTDISGQVSKDTTIINASFKSAYEIVISRERKSPFKYDDKVRVVPKNPYTDVTNLRSYATSLPKRKSLGVGPSAGITWGANGFAPYIGIGAQYNLFYFF